MNKTQSLLVVLSLTLIFSCQQKEKADLIVYGGSIYVSSEKVVSAMAVKNGVVLAVGDNEVIQGYKGESTQLVDLEGQIVFPGFQEGHAHLMGIGFNKINVDLTVATNYEQMVELVRKRASAMPPGTWIVGRGWHQEKWSNGSEFFVKGFPTHHLLSDAVPDHPVFLSHASGHAALVNEHALKVLGISKDVDQPEGGEYFLGIDGRPTGILNEAAQFGAGAQAWKSLEDQIGAALDSAIKECHRNGVTGFHDAGEDSLTLATYYEYLKDGKLDLRLNVMLSGSDRNLLKRFFESGKQLDSLDRLNIQSVKLYSDGALGSRGAWLLEEYSDAPGVFGHNITSVEDMEEVTKQAFDAGFQVCTHAIGDRANREVLDMYERVLKGDTTRRFRIEHAQHIHPDDIPRFAQLGVLPAMQAIHMSSDRPWAIDRLGKERIESGAYMWKSLIDNGSRIINGTDAPVEPVNPIASFYASVTRKTLLGKPEGGYEPKEKMSRQEALKSYTIWPAYGAFLESKLGTLEVGKYADFVILDRDIMTVPEEQLLETQILRTFFSGKLVYEKAKPIN